MNEVTQAASLAESIVEHVAPFCQSSECSESIASLKVVAARQRTLLKKPALTLARVHQMQKLLMAALERSVEAFKADHPEYKAQIEAGADLSSVAPGELQPLALAELSSMSPVPISPSLALSMAAPGFAPEPMVPGCSRMECRSRCSQLAQNLQFICAAYVIVCPICVVICLLVLAQQLAKCNARCDCCPNP